MKAFIALSCLVVVASARPGVLVNGPLGWNGVSAYSAGTPLASQYHAQDELGQYSYGYTGGPSSKAETKTADGITRGSFSYVDSHGLVQSRSYVADALGFRVAASDLPVGPAPVAAVAPVAVAAPFAAAPIAAGPVHVAALPAPVSDTYEVAAAKAQHYAAHAEARARNGEGLLLAGAPIAAPVAVAAGPVAVAAPVVAGAGLQSQYHAQDELGQYSYGYAGGLSAKNEAKTADGITRGSYSYVDAHGLVQSRSYVSDPINGFRVAASDLPVGPAPVAAAAPIAIAAPVAAAPIAVPAPIATPVAAPIAVAAPAYLSDDTVVVGGVADTPEVAAAKAAHYAAHHEAHARLAHAY